MNTGPVYSGLPSWLQHTSSTGCTDDDSNGFDLSPITPNLIRKTLSKCLIVPLPVLTELHIIILKTCRVPICFWPAFSQELSLPMTLMFPFRGVLGSFVSSTKKAPMNNLKIFDL